MSFTLSWWCRRKRPLQLWQDFSHQETSVLLLGWVPTAASGPKQHKLIWVCNNGHSVLDKQFPGNTVTCLVQKYCFVSSNCIYYLCSNERCLLDHRENHFTEGKTGTLRNSSCYSIIIIILMPSWFSVWGTSHCNKAEIKDAISWHFATLDIKV